MKKEAWKLIKASRSGPKVSHLFFADDIMLFAEAREDQVSCIKEGLEIFCKAFNQRMGFEKSSMLLSPNIPDEVATDLSIRICIPRTKDFKEISRFPHQSRGEKY